MLTLSVIAFLSKRNRASPFAGHSRHADTIRLGKRDNFKSIRRPRNIALGATRSLSGGLRDLLAGVIQIIEQKRSHEIVFSSVDALIDSGWVID
jgi:hypothetical protein